MTPKQRARHVDRISKKITDLTDINDHTGALITLAKVIPNADKLLNTLVEIKREHGKLGHMPSNLISRREEVYSRLIVLAKAHFFGPGEFTKIYQAF